MYTIEEKSSKCKSVDVVELRAKKCCYSYHNKFLQVIVEVIRPMGSGASSLRNSQAFGRILPAAEAVRVNAEMKFVAVSTAFDVNDKSLYKESNTTKANMVECRDDDEETPLRPSQNAEELVANANVLIRAIKDKAIVEDSFLDEPLTPLQCAFVIHSSIRVHQVMGNPVALDVTLQIVSATLREISVSMAGYLTVKELHCALIDIDRMFKEE